MGKAIVNRKVMKKIFQLGNENVTFQQVFDLIDQDRLKLTYIEFVKKNMPLFYLDTAENHIKRLMDTISDMDNPMMLTFYLRCISNDISKDIAIKSGFLTEDTYNEFNNLYLSYNIHDFSI